MKIAVDILCFLSRLYSNHNDEIRILLYIVSCFTFPPAINHISKESFLIMASNFILLAILQYTELLSKKTFWLFPVFCCCNTMTK